MSKRPAPYIGVSGVVSRQQVHELTQRFEENNLVDKRLLALGVKAVHKTQYLDIVNKYGKEWYPVGKDGIKHAVDTTNDAVLGVAQVYMEPSLVSDDAYRENFMNQLTERCKSWIDAIQFDMLPWHVDELLFDFLEATKQAHGLTIILQCHNEAMQTLGPKRTSQLLGSHAHAFDYILFDASHGKGVSLNTEALKPYLETVYSSSQFNNVSIGIAGGLDGAHVQSALPELLTIYPDLSWDAEGKLHTALPAGAMPLDMRKVGAYFQSSSSVLGT